MISYLKKTFALSFFFTIALHAANNLGAKTYDELPALYRSAFKVNANFKGETLEVFLETFNGYNAYKDKLHFESDDYELVLKESTPALMGLDPITKKNKEFYKDQNTFLFDIKAKAASTHSIGQLKNLIVNLQACSKDNCLLPVSVSIPIGPLSSASIKQQRDEQPSLSTESSLASTIKNIFLQGNGILSFQALLILFFAGLITAVSPCVLPLFPLTLGIFGRWAHHDDRRAFLLTLSYGAGIVFCFALNGLLSAATGALFGSLTQNAYYLLFIGIVIFYSGLIFSGLIPFPLANFFLKLAGNPNAGDAKSSFGNHVAKSFVMGATLGLVASPCVGPILLTLLAWLSQKLPQGSLQSYASGFIALSVYGLGLAVPFLVLGHFYFRLHKRLQLGRFSLLAKYIGSVLLIASSFFFLIPGFKILSNKSASTDIASWEQRPSGKWLVVDFRADWCAACVEIEKDVLSQDKVKSYISNNNWSLVRVDMTNPDKNEKLAQNFGVISLPTLLFMKPNGEECKSMRLNEKEDIEVFLKRLQSADQNCR